MANSILDKVEPAVNLGYRIVGELLGHECDVYRPTTKDNPIAPINWAATTPVMFALDPGFKLLKPRDTKTVQMYGSYDRKAINSGDYIVDLVDDRTYFVSSQESLQPNGVVYCSVVLTFYRPTAQTSGDGSYRGTGYTNKNLNIYGGSVTNLGLPLAANWPASMVLGTKGERAQVNIPNQSRLPWYASRFPAIPGVALKTNDLVIYGNRRFLLSGVELNDLGYNTTLDEVSL